MTDYIDVDVRPILRAGGEPFSIDHGRARALEPGQGLRLYATFKPIPLFGVMADKGFAHSENELDGGEWEVLFTSRRDRAARRGCACFAGFRTTGRIRSSASTTAILTRPNRWSGSSARAEKLNPGETLSALLRREPVFLFRELEKRGFRLARRVHAGRIDLRTHRAGAGMMRRDLATWSGTRSGSSRPRARTQHRRSRASSTPSRSWTATRASS